MSGALLICMASRCGMRAATSGVQPHIAIGARPRRVPMAHAGYAAQLFKRMTPISIFSILPPGSCVREAMQRRDFVRLVGMAAAWPLGARAQQAGKTARIGVLWRGAGAEQEGANIKALLKGLSDNGHSEGRDIALEHR